MKEDTPYQGKLLDIISNMVCVCSGETIAWINPAGVKMLGADGPDAVVGMSFSALVSSDFADLIALGLDAFAEEDAGVPLKLIPLSGPHIDVQMRVTRIEGITDGTFVVECRDITEFIRSAEQARQRQQRLAGILDAMAETVIVIDQDGTVTSFNPAAESMFGYVAREVVGKNVQLLMPAPHATQHDGYLANYVETGEKKAIGKVRELEGKRKDGSIFPIEIAVSVLHEGGRRVFTGIIRDITERKRAEDQIRHLAHHDPLTGLPNRNLFQERLERAINRAERAGNFAVLMFVDLDKFKPINDSLGHEAGDLVLKGVGERLSGCVRSADTVARIGGDEFVLILEGMDDWSNAAPIAQKIIDCLVEPFQVPGTQCAVGASIGVSVYPVDADTPDGLIKAADEVMYRVKAEGRNNFKFFTDPSLAIAVGKASSRTRT